MRMAISSSSVVIEDDVRKLPMEEVEPGKPLPDRALGDGPVLGGSGGPTSRDGRSVKTRNKTTSFDSACRKRNIQA